MVAHGNDEKVAGEAGAAVSVVQKTVAESDMVEGVGQEYPDCGSIEHAEPEFSTVHQVLEVCEG